MIWSILYLQKITYKPKTNNVALTGTDISLCICQSPFFWQTTLVESRTKSHFHQFSMPLLIAAFSVLCEFSSALGIFLLSVMTNIVDFPQQSTYCRNVNKISILIKCLCSSRCRTSLSWIPNRPLFLFLPKMQVPQPWQQSHMIAIGKKGGKESWLKKNFLRSPMCRFAEKLGVASRRQEDRGPLQLWHPRRHLHTPPGPWSDLNPPQGTTDESATSKSTLKLVRGAASGGGDWDRGWGCLCGLCRTDFVLTGYTLASFNCRRY
jgi:hypothetical protein